MKKIIGVLLFIFVVASMSFTTQKECRKYFSGKWKYVKYDVDYIYVVRDDKKQFAYMENGKYYYEFDITWLTECNYELTYVGTNSPNAAAAEIGEKFTVELITVNDSITEYKTVFRDLEDVGKMVRIE
ncbi:MAG: hypothetical protein AB8B65_11110 [Kordia sp.]|uniref:hypothetical protein n=1 Tax=Kordia sp. TaxID=1965332 RepID=UPI00385D8831